jgi:hypothetical protein
MCDCSLMGVPIRRAVEGEQLVVHRFRTGSLGLAAPSGSEPAHPPTVRLNTFWARLKLIFKPPERHSVLAVCMPPGAQLVVEDIPAYLHRAIGVGPIELATFTRMIAPGGSPGQSEAAGSYRDAVRFKNGREVRLQELREGQRMWVMDLSRAPSSEPVREAISQGAVCIPSPRNAI